MRNLQKILVGIDLHRGDRLADGTLNAAATALLHQATELARETGARLTYCAVLDVSEQALALINTDEEAFRRSVEQIAHEALAKLVFAAKEAGLEAEATVRFGHAWEELTRQAIQMQADVLMVGTRERSTAARWIFGSTSQHLMRVCPCPVWICKPSELREIREILCACDLTDVSHGAMHTAVDVARLISARLYFAHVAEFSVESYLRANGVEDEQIESYRSSARQEAEDRLTNLVRETDYRTVQQGTKISVLEGSLEAVLPQFIEENGVDLVVLGTHGRSGLSGVILGNTAERLLPHLHASLLVVKPDGFHSPVTV